MKNNFTRWLESKIKPVFLVLAFIGFLALGFCKEARADVTFEVGPTFLSGEYADGQALLLSERFDKYTIGIGYIRDQNFTDRGDIYWELPENAYVQGYRNVSLTKRLTLGMGVAYFNTTNRALSSEFNFSLLARWDFSDHWSLNFRHYSNAGSKRPNLGQDMLTIGYTF